VQRRGRARCGDPARPLEDTKKRHAPPPLGSESPNSTRALKTDSHCSRWT
jgi:hypothetical protein